MRFDPDRAARELVAAARWFRRMPPCWAGDRIAQPILHPASGALLGHALMGTGLLLAGDLAAYGISRPLPHVFERSRVMYGHDTVAALTGRLGLPPLGDRWYRTLPGRLFCPERAGVQLARWGIPISRTVWSAKQLAAAITTYDGIITARGGANANDAVMSKASITTVAQAFSTLFRCAGLPPAGTYTNIPGGAVHTRASTGAWNGLKDPGGSNKKYLLTFGFGSSSVIDWAILVDLLVAAGNISASITTDQTVNSAAQTRQYGSTLGAGIMAAFEVTTALGTGTGTFALKSYTDQDNNAANVGANVTSVASAIAQRLMPSTANALPWCDLAGNDFGVRSLETFAFSAAHTAGVIALNLVYPLAYLPGVAANLYVERDSTTQIDGLTELVNASQTIGCVTVFVQTNSTTSGTFKGFARTCEG